MRLTSFRNVPAFTVSSRQHPVNFDSESRNSLPQMRYFGLQFRTNQGHDSAGVTGETILLDQNVLILKAGGVMEQVIKQQLETLGRLINVVKTEPDEKTLPEKLKAVARKLTAKLNEADKESVGMANSSESTAAMLASPLFRSFLTYDPQPTLTRIRCPMLAIGGELELQVPADVNLAAIAKALEQGGIDRSPSRKGSASTTYFSMPRQTRRRSMRRSRRHSIQRR
jgi:hypothetical protein